MTEATQIEVVLDAEHASRLSEIAARVDVDVRVLASALLSRALDAADVDAVTVTAILDAIPGAWERTEAGLEDARAGRVVPLDQI